MFLRYVCPIKFTLNLSRSQEENEQADFISRILDFDDWMLVMFAELDHEWGPHTIDRFVDVHKAELYRSS